MWPAAAVATVLGVAVGGCQPERPGAAAGPVAGEPTPASNVDRAETPGTPEPTAAAVAQAAEPASAPTTGPADAIEALRDVTPADVASQRWQHRLLIIFSDEETDPRLATQRRLLGPAIAQLRERDVLLIEVVGDDPLREGLGVEKRGFHALLVGKDGGVKLREREPVRPQTLLAVIDAMPMRQAEMRERGGNGEGR